MSESSEFVTESESEFESVMERAKRVFSVSDDKGLAELLGMRPNAFANRKGRASIPYRDLIRAAESHHVSLDALFGVAQSQSLYELMGVEQKVYDLGVGRTPDLGDTVHAGIIAIPRYEEREPSGAKKAADNEVVVESFVVNEAFVRAHQLAIDRVVTLSVQESSMSPTLEHGDQVIVDRSVERIDADGVYAVRLAGVLKIRRFQVRADGGLMVISDNPVYQPEVIETERLKDAIVVIGRVLPYKFGRIRL